MAKNSFLSIIGVILREMQVYDHFMLNIRQKGIIMTVAKEIINQNNNKEISEGMQEVVFVQLMEHIRQQDNLIYNWTKHYLLIQTSLAVALGFFLKYNGNERSLLTMMCFLFAPVLLV